MTTKIEWVKNADGSQGVTWNPVTGCSKVSPGCDHCYAERMSKRLAGRCGYPKAPHSFDVALHPERLSQPLRWRKPRTVFVCSMGDLFHDEVPDEFIAAVFGVMAATPQHRYMLLTKRPEQARMWFGSIGRDPRLEACWEALRHEALHHSDGIGGPLHTRYAADPEGSWPLPNVVIGVTAEDQQRADERIPILLQIPAALHWVSIEPCLGSIDLSPRLDDPTGPSLGFVVVGGETGGTALGIGRAVPWLD